MPVNGKIGEINIKEVQVLADVEHKPVILTKNLKAGQGILEAGSIIAKDGQGKLVLYDPTKDTHQIIGVLASQVDTDRQTLANVIVHGVVLKKVLKAKSQINDAVLDALEAKTIWTI